MISGRLALGLLLCPRLVKDGPKPTVLFFGAVKLCEPIGAGLIEGYFLFEPR